MSHLGKIYNVLANAIAHDIVAPIDGIEEAEVKLLPTIGDLIGRGVIDVY